MNCTCIEELEQKLVGKEFGDKRRKIIGCDIPVLFTISKDLGDMSTATYSLVELKVDGYRHSQKEKIMHSYCPFCGTKI